MFNIDSIISLLFNLVFDIRDSIENNEPMSLDKSTITLVAVCDNSLPMPMINQYCENLEVIYASYIRSLLSVGTRTRIDSNAKSIFRSLPLLTPYDTVKFNEKLDAFESARKNIFTNAKSSSSMVSYFAEEAKKELMKVEEMKSRSISNLYSYEANDAFLQENRGGVPTFVNADISVTALGKTVDKKVSIGVRVIPKLVDKEWLMSFFIKKGKIAVNNTGDSFFGKLKAKLKVNKNRLKSVVIPGSQKKNLVEMFDMVEKVNKPFVCILLNNTTATALESAGLKIMSPDVLKNIYNRYPVVSVGIINTHLDNIKVSLTRDSSYVQQTLSEFNSEVATYQKELAEIVRANSRF